MYTALIIDLVLCMAPAGAAPQDCLNARYVVVEMPRRRTQRRDVEVDRFCLGSRLIYLLWEAFRALFLPRLRGLLLCSMIR